MEETRVLRTSCARRMITVQLIVDVALWLTVALPVLYLFLRGRPYVQGFFCGDPSLSYPYKQDTISTLLLVVAGFATSVAVIVLVEVINIVDRNCQQTCRYVSRIPFCLKAYAVFLVGFVIEELFVEVIKNSMGVLRPNFFDVCRPQFNITLCPRYVMEYTCAGEDIKEILKSRQSFPSGHSAFSSYIAIFFSIYIQRNLNISYSCILKMFMQIALNFVAVLCGLGRIRDNKHHPSDVIAGFFIGTSVAVFVWRMLGEVAFKHFSDSKLPERKASETWRSEDWSCACLHVQEVDSEPQTSAQLLPKEFIHAIGNGHKRDTCSIDNVTYGKCVSI